jgi:hypothetical protein
LPTKTLEMLDFTAFEIIKEIIIYYMETHRQILFVGFFIG